MSMETRIPKEIHDYREKNVFGLSARQLAALGAAACVVLATGIPLYYLAGIDLKVLEYVLILEAMPIIAVGFIRYRGLPFEKYARIWLNHRFGEKRLIYKTNVSNLSSLYSLSADRRKEGAGRREIPQKEIPTRVPPRGHRATGPSTFDCSGLTQWCYARAEITIPRNSEAPLDRAARANALASDEPDFEDGLVREAAETARADFIVTRDVAAFASSTARPVEPALFADTVCRR